MVRPGIMTQKESGTEQIKEGYENRNDAGSVLRYHR
jgi:hypothetical protein